MISDRLMFLNAVDFAYQFGKKSSDGQAIEASIQVPIFRTLRTWLTFSAHRQEMSKAHLGRSNR